MLHGAPDADQRCKPVRNQQQHDRHATPTVPEPKHGQRRGDERRWRATMAP
jgi:hypothetical protein